MVICIIAAVVLGVMSVFSAKYRKWAREAAGCVFRMTTLRACETGFDEKVKSAITAVIMPRHEGLARFTHKHFKAISWVFVIIFFASAAYTGYTIYNLAVYGTCDPVNPQNCVFNPGGDPNKVVCPYEGLDPEVSVGTVGGFRNIEYANISGRPTVYFLGTTWCPHCAWERPVFMNVTAKFADYIDVRKVEIDIEQPAEEMELFSHYSPGGSIPVIIIGGKYFRVGSGEFQGAENETATLTAILCKTTNNSISECSEPAMASLVSAI
jgi:thiol-disulfide isomerase/thioredoxin